MVRADLLRKEMRIKDVSVDALSEALGMNKSTFYRKLNGDTIPFDTDDLKVMRKVLKLSFSKMNDIFFK